jgi:hypothetical protein
MLAYDRAFDPPRMLDTALLGLECTLGMAAGDGHGPLLGRLQEAQKQRATQEGLRHSHFDLFCNYLNCFNAEQRSLLLSPPLLCYWILTFLNLNLNLRRHRCQAIRACQCGVTCAHRSSQI